MLDQAAKALTDHIFDIIPLLLAFLGILGFLWEMRAKRKADEKAFQLDEKKFQLEEQERENYEHWLNRQSLRIDESAHAISEQVAVDLKKDVAWITEALTSAKIGIQAQSIFFERLGHFGEEKEFLAKEFVRPLILRCKRLANSGKQVHLLIDSGTTLYPFFRYVAAEVLRAKEANESWLSNFEIATNSLAGVQKLMEKGRINPNTRNSPLAMNCRLFPGTPLPIFSAVTGGDTCDAVKQLGDGSDNSYVIALVVGNWIRINDTDRTYPIPLTRSEGQSKFKEAMINKAQEVYVVTPLGKVWLNSTLGEINDALGLKRQHDDLDRQWYQEVSIDRGRAARVKMVTTGRTEDRVLSKLSIRLGERLHAENTLKGFEDHDAKDLQNIMIPFHRLSEDWWRQLETEFPHDYLRNRSELLNKCFFVRQSSP